MKTNAVYQALLWAWFLGCRAAPPTFELY